MNMKKWSKGLIAVFLVSIASFILAKNYKGRPEIHLLPNGETIHLNQVLVTTNAEIRHGNIAEKLLGNFIPTNGLNLGKINLQRPDIWHIQSETQTPVLATVFQASINLFQRGPGPRSHRLILSGDDSFSYVYSLSDFRKERDGLFNQMTFDAYPRDSKTLHFKIQSIIEDNWTDVTEFIVQNPQITNPHKDWSNIQSFPAKTRINDLDVELSGISIAPAVDNSIDPLWKHSVVFNWKITRKGQPMPHWAARELRVEDALGNRMKMRGKLIKLDGVTVNQHWRSLDPKHPWRIEAELGPASDYSANTICHFTLPPDLSYEQEIPQNGYIFSIKRLRDGGMTVKLLDEPEDARLTFLSVKLDDDTQLRNTSGNWSQHHWTGNNLAIVDSDGGIHLGKLPEKDIIVSFAVHENVVPVQFTVRPNVLENQ